MKPGPNDTFQWKIYAPCLDYYVPADVLIPKTTFDDHSWFYAGPGKPRVKFKCALCCDTHEVHWPVHFGSLSDAPSHQGPLRPGKGPQRITGST